MTNIVVIYISLLVTYLTHYHSYALLIMCLTFFALYASVYDALRRIWGYKETSQPLIQRLKDGVITLKPALTFIGALIPAYFILFSYYFYLSNTYGSNSEHKGFEWLTDYFFAMKSLVAFRDDHVLIGRVLLGLFAIAFVLTVINRIRQCHEKELGERGERLWTRAVSQIDGFLLMAVFITAMYFIAPWSGYSGGWINDRFHLYIFLVLLPFFAINVQSAHKLRGGRGHHRPILLASRLQYPHLYATESGHHQCAFIGEYERKGYDFHESGYHQWDFIGEYERKEYDSHE